MIGGLLGEDCAGLRCLLNSGVICNSDGMVDAVRLVGQPSGGLCILGYLPERIVECLSWVNQRKSRLGDETVINIDIRLASEQCEFRGIFRFGLQVT